MAVRTEGAIQRSARSRSLIAISVVHAGYRDRVSSLIESVLTPNRGTIHKMECHSASPRTDYAASCVDGRETRV